MGCCWVTARCWGSCGDREYLCWALPCSSPQGPRLPCACLSFRSFCQPSIGELHGSPLLKEHPIVLLSHGMCMGTWRLQG